MRLNAIFLVFWMLSFKPTFSFSSFTFIKRLFSFSSLSAIRVVLYLHICISEVIAISPGHLDSSLCFFQPSISHDVLCIEVKLAGWQYTNLTYSFSYLEPVCCSMSSSIKLFILGWITALLNFRAENESPDLYVALAPLLTFSFLCCVSPVVTHPSAPGFQHGYPPTPNTPQNVWFVYIPQPVQTTVSKSQFLNGIPSVKEYTLSFSSGYKVSIIF